MTLLACQAACISAVVEDASAVREVSCRRLEPLAPTFLFSGAADEGLFFALHGC
jgi:hypothetical protein